MKVEPGELASRSPDRDLEVARSDWTQLAQRSSRRSVDGRRATCAGKPVPIEGDALLVSGFAGKVEIDVALENTSR